TRAVAELKPRERAKLIGYLPQHPALAWSLSVADVVALGRYPHQAGWQLRNGARGCAPVIAALHDTALHTFAERPVSTLSGGEQMRVHLARLLAGQHPIILADEPIASLDPRYQLEILNHLARVAHSGTAVAIVLHDLPLAARFCTRLLVLDRGAVIADDHPESALSDEVLAQVFGVRSVREPNTGQLIALASPEPRPAYGYATSN
ncbi:MAG: ABC transporter ATP-binding protein, partial [Gammaproteobacteria bacterium]